MATNHSKYNEGEIDLPLIFFYIHLYSGTDTSDTHLNLYFVTILSKLFTQFNLKTDFTPKSFDNSKMNLSIKNKILNKPNEDAIHSLSIFLLHCKLVVHCGHILLYSGSDTSDTKNSNPICPLLYYIKTFFFNLKTDFTCTQVL